mgnify:CR=1 FL=1
MNAFEICPDRIVATRYSTGGQYGEAEIIDRNMKTNVALVTVEGDREGTVGSVAGAVAIASGVEDPVYTWASSNEGVASVSYSDRVARITYNSVGTATIRVRVAERNDPSKNAVYTYNVTVSENTSSEPNVAIYRAKEQEDGNSADGGDFVSALSAKVCLAQADAYYTSPAFNGSSEARDQVGALLTKCLAMTGDDIDAQIADAFAFAVEECEYNS